VLGAAGPLFGLRCRASRRQGSPADVTGWRRQQIETAVPVADDNVAYRSDQLIGASIVNVQDESLGSVDDIVMNPQTGKIATSWSVTAAFSHR